MPKWVKVLLWIGVFLACAGVGAYVAAHTDPFPPGVDDPGANSAGPVSTEVPSGGVVVLIDTRTSHDLYVGGRCAISWRIELGLGDARAVHRPVGAQELTGFAKTIPTLRFELPAHEGATATFDVDVSDRDRGTYGAVGTVTVSSVPAS